MKPQTRHRSLSANNIPKNTIVHNKDHQAFFNKQKNRLHQIAVLCIPRVRQSLENCRIDTCRFDELVDTLIERFVMSHSFEPCETDDCSLTIEPDHFARMLETVTSKMQNDYIHMINPKPQINSIQLIDELLQLVETTNAECNEIIKNCLQ
jgi:hypothetical protein